MNFPCREDWAELADFIAERVVEKLEQREQVNALADLVIEQLLAAPDDQGKLNARNARAISERFIETIPPYPDKFAGKGIVICGGGVTYFTNAWVTIRLLRALGCTLPIQLWHLGPAEVDERMKSLVVPFDVECVDAFAVREKHPARILAGWEIKPYSILHSPFQEVLYLDADNVPAKDPTFLFEIPAYREAGAVFWPDITNRLPVDNPIWAITGIAYRDEPEFESGQVLVDKKRCWKALSLCLWYNEHSDFFYRLVHGDKETFHLAFRKRNEPYAMPQKAVYDGAGVIYQHDFDGDRLFQHRVGRKWSLDEDKEPIPGFLHEAECQAYLEELRSVWDGSIEVS